MPAPRILGLDFGTTNSVAAVARGDGSDLVVLDSPDGGTTGFRSALCFWEDEAVRGGIAVEAGPQAIAEYLEFPQGSRFLQSFKSVAASPSFEHATIFERRYRFEDLGRTFLRTMAGHSRGSMADVDRLIIGRPVVYAGHAPDTVLARQRYDLMFDGIAAERHYVYEPLGAAFSYATRITDPATILVADFGGGTSDFSVVRIEAPGAARRCIPLGYAGVGIAGDRFDARIVEQLVMPLLGLGGSYRSFGKVLEIPRGYFADFADWSRLALMRNRKTVAELEKLQRTALDPGAIGRMIAIIEEELGFRLHEAVGKVKRDLSSAETAHFHFSGAGLAIEADVTRAAFERWIAPEIAEIAAAVDRALAAAAVDAGAIDRVFLTGGSSLIPCIGRLFADRFGADRIATGGELTSIAHGLALIGAQDDLTAWTA
ncbi:Hsp70 family protein [Polymorphobacter fuscus]|uniref:Hsp70 family protein n=1 Tax=Sandarakinorhabdus fusca TaxID=1439888 RepID=A0A7C9GR42_9SPHN|nr:Hsp70 family protein [Polymorphobacter fuscus]KAB7644887.1 Hsp70 family protein [Polymorphobacter fuscus]MQT18170.1 Hsp70 family protein [Polymorphobacter fuscus]NJC09489.1 putative chaperone protein [Polymorphobacter fuscus]